MCDVTESHLHKPHTSEDGEVEQKHPDESGSMNKMMHKNEVMKWKMKIK